MLDVPPRIDGSLVQPAMAPYWSHFGAIDASEFVRPNKLKSPKWSSDGFCQASIASAGGRSWMPRPAFRRPTSVPLSKNAAPLDAIAAPATIVFGSDAKPLSAIWRDAQKLTLPAPAPVRPASGR